ncbi:MAG TPA: EthD family reductase [Solirubrobacteraceae bacterium]|nr:EthD family reductase [Solirubrobacteraceae bacterium]
MVKLVVCYGTPEDMAAFDAHYTETHVPLVHKIPSLKRFEHGKVLGTPDGARAPYYYLAELWFDSPGDLQGAMQSAEGEAAGADVPAFASGGATLMIAEAS